MKNFKIVLLVAFSLFSVWNIQAQKMTKLDQASFQEGQLSLKLGVGIVPLGILQGQMVGQPTIIADYAVTAGSSIGAFFIPSYNSVEVDWRAKLLLNRQKVIAGIRYLGHVKNLKSWDIYGGFQVGYLATLEETILEKDYVRSDEKTASDEYIRTYQAKVAYSPVLGFKYQPSQLNFGAFAELGFNGTSFGTAGLSYRFN